MHTQFIIAAWNEKCKTIQKPDSCRDCRRTEIKLNWEKGTQKALPPRQTAGASYLAAGTFTEVTSPSRTVGKIRAWRSINV